MAEINKIFETASFSLVSGSFEVTGGNIDVGAGDITASQLFGTASCAITASLTATASLATNVTFAPLIVPIPALLEETILTDVKESVEPIESAESAIKFDLSRHRHSRLGVTITADSSNGGRPRLAIQFSLDDGASFDFLDGINGPFVDITGSAAGNIRVVGASVNHLTESFTNVLLRAVTYSGSATPPFESPTILAGYIFFTTDAGGII